MCPCRSTKAVQQASNKAVPAGARGSGTAEARARPNASVQRRAAQRAVCCNRLLGGMRESSQLHPPQKLGVDRDDHCARRHQNRTHGWG